MIGGGRVQLEEHCQALTQSKHHNCFKKIILLKIENYKQDIVLRCGIEEQNNQMREYLENQILVLRCHGKSLQHYSSKKILYQHNASYLWRCQAIEHEQLLTSFNSNGLEV